MDTKEKLSLPTVALHWVVATFIIALTALGMYMEDAGSATLYMIHKSFGVLIFVVILVRVFWRFKNGWPEPVSQYKKFEIVLSKIVHWALLLLTIIMPISGMMMSGFGGHGFGIFGLELVARNPDPASPDKVIAINGTLAQIGHVVHGGAKNVLIAAIVLHVVGALKHHFVDKDATLKRMLGK